MLKAIETEYKSGDAVWYRYEIPDMPGRYWNIPASFVRYITKRPAASLWEHSQVVIKVLLKGDDRHTNVSIEKLSHRDVENEPKENKLFLWHQLPDETPWGRIARINQDIHHIFLEGRNACSPEYLDWGLDGSAKCFMCKAHGKSIKDIKHSTPHFLQSMDASRLIIESGKFVKVEDAYENRLVKGGKETRIYECIAYPHNPLRPFSAQGSTPMEARCLAMLSAWGYNVIGKDLVIQELFRAVRSA